MRGGHGTDTEVGRLRTVLVHRPGAELRRITPGNCAAFPFGRVPWLSRAQQEHDQLTGTLRDHDVDVLYLTELLQDVLEFPTARDQVAAAVLDGAQLGSELDGQLRSHLDGLDPEALCRVLITGLTRDEFRDGRGAVHQLLDPQDHLIEPLPGLLFTRDSSLWVGDRVVVTSPAGRTRRREASRVRAVYDHHPMFAGRKALYRPGPEALDGGEVLLLAPGVIAVGTGGRTCAAAVERLARSAFTAGSAHTVLAVPIGAGGAPDRVGHLDTICTMAGPDSVIMHPALAYSMTARSITARTSAAEDLRVSHPRPFLEAAALAMGIERLRVIDTGLSPAVPGRGQWDDGGNTLITGVGRAVAFERTAETSARLEEVGLAVSRVPGHELASDRGGPRGLVCPVSREPGELPDQPLRAEAGSWPRPQAGQEPPTRVDQQPGPSDPGLPIEAGV